MNYACPIHHTLHDIGEECPGCVKARTQIKVEDKPGGYEPGTKMWRVVKGLCLSFLAFWVLIILGAIMIHSN